MTDFEWKALGDDVSEQKEAQAQNAPTQGGQSRFMTFLDIASRAGIILAIFAFFSEYSNSNIQRTGESIKISVLKPTTSDGAAMALSYLNQEIYYPLCPFAFCKVRSRHSFENLEFYNSGKDEGIRLVKDNMPSKALMKASFRSSDLRKVSISEISLNRVRFSETKLQNAELLNVDLSCSKFLNSDLSGAVVQYKSLQGADFYGTNISKLQLIDEEGNSPQEIDESEDRGQIFKQFEKKGLTPNTFAGAWAWKGEEPILPKAYRTYQVCSKPEDLSVLIKGQLGRPEVSLCEAPQAKAPPAPVNVCQQLDASVGMGDAVVSWVDRQISALTSD